MLTTSCSTIGESLQVVGGNTIKCGVGVAMKCDESAWTRPFILVPSIFPIMSIGFPVWTLGYILEENTNALLR